jgi:hypothetical protein
MRGMGDGKLRNTYVIFARKPLEQQALAFSGYPD